MLFREILRFEWMVNVVGNHILSVVTRVDFTRCRTDQKFTRRQGGLTEGTVVRGGRVCDVRVGIKRTD